MCLYIAPVLKSFWSKKGTQTSQLLEWILKNITGKFSFLIFSRTSNPFISILFLSFNIFFKKVNSKRLCPRFCQLLFTIFVISSSFKLGKTILQLSLAIWLYLESLPKNINELLIIFEDIFFEKGNNKKIIILNKKNSNKYLIEIKKVIID